MRRVIAISCVALSMIAGMIVAGTGSASAVVVNPSPLAGVGANGTVRAIDVVGTTAYVGGSFSAVTGTNGTFSRSNIAAFDVETGRVISDFAPSVDASVYAVKADGDFVYAGGDFKNVNGVVRKRLAALTSSGALVAGFRGAQPSGRVRTIEKIGSQLWIGGGFDYVSGSYRSAVAVVDAATGTISPITLHADRTVRSIKADPTGDRVFIGGDFSELGDTFRDFLAVVSPDTGEVSDQQFPSLLREGDNVVIALDVDVESGQLFGGVGGVKAVGLGNQVAAWDLETGALNWSIVTDGDVQAVDVENGTVYFGFHEGFAGDSNLKLLSADVATGQVHAAFRPRVNSFFGVWAIGATPYGVVAGGEFTTVNDATARRIAIFQPSHSTHVELLTATSQWRYWDEGSLAGDSWRSASYGDGAWRSGTPQFGYGDGDESTVIGYGPRRSKKHVTSYFRATFSVDDPAALSDVVVQLMADDGAAVYLNGIEIVRDNLPAGVLSGETLAASTRDGVYESLFRQFDIDPGHLRSGVNTIAVEVHQVNVGSSDTSFDLRLGAIRS